MSSDALNTPYIHGTSVDEQDRLTLMNRLINQACLSEMRLEGKESVIDVGGGLGDFSREIARAVTPDGAVLVIERDRKQLDEAVRRAADAGESHLLEFRQGDATDLPLSGDEWGSFDVAHARFVLEHVPDPLAVVRQMVRAVKPGGRIILADDDHDLLRLWPEPPGAMAAWQAYVRTYELLGNDAYVGRHLIQLLHEAGARPVRNTGVFYGGCAGDPRFAGLVTNLIEVLRGARETVVQHKQSDPQSYDSAIQALREWQHRPDAALWYTINWAEGVRSG